MMLRTPHFAERQTAVNVDDRSLVRPPRSSLEQQQLNKERITGVLLFLLLAALCGLILWLAAQSPSSGVPSSDYLMY